MMISESVNIHIAGLNDLFTIPNDRTLLIICTTTTKTFIVVTISLIFVLIYYGTVLIYPYVYKV